MIFYKAESVRKKLIFVTACNVGFYGSNCKEPCGHCLKALNCSFTNGTCFGGCMEGFTGDTCHGNIYYRKKQPEADNMYRL